MARNSEGAAERTLSKLYKEGIEDRYEQSDFESIGGGDAWDVKRYKDPRTGELSGEFVVKELYRYRLVPEFYDDRTRRPDDPVAMSDPETRKGLMENSKRILEKTADRLCRESDYLKRMYAARLPHLILDEKIMTVFPKNDRQRGEIISVQELVGEHLCLDRLDNLHKLIADEEKQENALASLKEQLAVFVEITKTLFTHEDEDPDFTHALPDISHFGNLVAERNNDDLVLRLIDTNYVMPVEHPKSQGVRHDAKILYWLLYMEVHILGKRLEELQDDPAYKDSEVLKGVLAYHEDVPYFPDARSIPYQLGIIGESPVKRARELRQMETDWNTRMDAFFQTLRQEPYYSSLTLNECSPRQIDIEKEQQKISISFDKFAQDDAKVLVSRKGKLMERPEILHIHEAMLPEFILREVSE
jgi:hypothetical protein